MTRRRIGLYGVHDESLRLLRVLADVADVEVVQVYDPEPDAALERAAALGRDLVDFVQERRAADFEAFAEDPRLDAIVDDGVLEPFFARYPAGRDRGLQIVSPLTARLLYGYGAAPRDRKAELLQALTEVVESVELTIDSRELFARMLEIAVGVTGADGGSLMLLDEAGRALHIKVAIGIEPELWGKIRVPLGDGISGVVAATAQSIHLKGKADRRRFQIQRERMDVESALSAPLVHEGKVLGVLNLHHAFRSDAFDDGDLAFVEQLARLDAQIITRAQEHERLRDQAARYQAVQEIQGILADANPLAERLQTICRRVAERMGGGIANIYLCDAQRDAGELLLTATSLAGGGFGGEYRIVVGQGVDGGAAQSRRPSFLRGERGAIAYAALPLIVGDRLMGVLAAQAGAEPPTGRAAEEGLLEIAAAVAEGVSRARKEADMRARATRMSAINEAGIRMLSAIDVAEVARLATSSLAMILDADHAVLRLQEPRSRRYKVSSYFGSADDALQPKLFELDKLVSIEALKRRTAFLVRDLASDSKLAPFAGDITSLISAPLKVEGTQIGTISIYDKVAIDRFFVGRFDDEDMHVFAKFVSYVQRSVANARAHADARDQSNFDSETGLPNARYLDSRIREEIVRADDRPQALAVATCTIENWAELSEAGDPNHAHRVLVATAEALRAALRDFDVLARVDTARFAILLPEPGADAAERVSEIARMAADPVRRDEALNEPCPVELGFGYASHPDDGANAYALLDAAAATRIRMV